MGLFVGGTAAANQLEDYEEGTYTPYLGASGNNTSSGMLLYYSAQHGDYVKIGHIVVCSATLTWTNKTGSNSSNNSDLTLTLPFNIGDSSFTGQATIGYNNAIDFNADSRGIHVVGSGSIIYFDNVQQGSGKHNGYVGTENVASSGHMRIGITYITTA